MKRLPELDRLVPVSYTHLDVYKRQGSRDSIHSREHTMGKGELAWLVMVM